MSWAIGFDRNWHRDIGYGVPALCDHPDCNEQINRGLGYVCGSEPMGGEHGCGLYFCGEHQRMAAVPVGEASIEDDDAEAAQLCERCAAGADPFTPKPDIKLWRDHKRTDPSWDQWRAENPGEAAKL